MNKKTEKPKVYDAKDYLPKGIGALIPDEEDKTTIIIEKFYINKVDDIANIWVNGEEYFTTSKYIIETLEALQDINIPFPFSINLIRREGKESGNIYYDLRP